jgi:carbonic anhydrase-like protein
MTQAVSDHSSGQLDRQNIQTGFHACCNHGHVHDRRGFLRAFALGGAALASGVSLLRGSAFAAEGTDALLLNCIDYRLTSATTSYMAAQGMAGKYDQFILAGAALGALTNKYPAWGKTFWEHLQVAIDLHHIRKVVVLDHRDCGAYKVILGKDFAKDPKQEFDVHAKEMRALRAAIHRKDRALQVALGLMALDGSVEQVS